MNNGKIKTDEYSAQIGFTYAIIANLIWATSFIASKLTLQSWGAITASMLRFFLAVIIMSALFPMLGIKIHLPRSKREWFVFAGIGIVGFGFLYPLQLTGLEMVSTSISAAIMLLSPLFVILLAKFFLKENLDHNKLIAIILGILGGIILLTEKSNFLLGISSKSNLGAFITLFASISLAASVVLTRKFASSINIFQLTYWPMLIGTVIMAPFSIYEEKGLSRIFSSLSYSSLYALLYLSIACSVFSFLLWNIAISKTHAKNLASTMHIKTPVAIFLGIIFLQEEMDSIFFLGATIIIFSVWLSQYKRKEKTNSLWLANKQLGVKNEN